MILEATAVLACPVALGMLAGTRLRGRVGHRVSGGAAAFGCLALPTAAAAAITVAFPLVGLWDAVTEGFLCGAGLLCVAHQFAGDPRDVRRTLGSVLATGLLLELGSRLFLGAPPAYPVGDGPSFFLSTVLRTMGPDSPTFRVGGIPSFLERYTMRATPGRGGMEDRPPAEMVTREIVCAIAYGPAYRGLIASVREHTEVLPGRFIPRLGAARRVLHVGDSMVFGANVRREETFAADLERLEPGVQHVNAGISGTAPDDYLVVLRAWVARHPVDLAVVYLFAGNDMGGLDAPHPCSNWKSILVYSRGRATLRYPAGPRTDRGIGLKWLLLNSPLPYLGRVLIAWNSHAAAFLGGALDTVVSRATREGVDTGFAHLEAILRSARDELNSKRIPLVVVVLPAAAAIDTPGGPSVELSQAVVAIARRLAIHVLDATPLLRDALAHGAHPVQPDGSHFNSEGHRLIAAWLHERLYEAAERDR